VQFPQYGFHIDILEEQASEDQLDRVKRDLLSLDVADRKLQPGNTALGSGSGLARRSWG
jgi:hypothetical protein